MRTTIFDGYSKKGELGIQFALCSMKELVVGGEFVVLDLQVVEVRFELFLGTLKLK